MVALKNYSEIVKECVKQKIDLIISGAGIPKELPEYVKGKLDDGLIFCGSNVSKIKEIVSVHDLMQELVCQL